MRIKFNGVNVILILIWRALIRRWWVMMSKYDSSITRQILMKSIIQNTQIILFFFSSLIFERNFWQYLWISEPSSTLYYFMVHQICSIMIENNATQYFWLKFYLTLLFNSFIKKNCSKILFFLFK